MKVEHLEVGALGTNCYVIVNEETKDTLVVDPGGNGRMIAEHLKESGYTLGGILLTHGHFDHTDGIADLIEGMGSDTKVYALDEEKMVLESPQYNLSASMGRGGKTYKADDYFTDGEDVSMSGMDFKVIATPGHTPGGCCFYFPQESILFSGDTLFSFSIGRTDFPGGDHNTLISSIREKLFSLPGDTLVLPGHMGPTTIENEIEGNPFAR